MTEWKEMPKEIRAWRDEPSGGIIVSAVGHPYPRSSTIYTIGPAPTVKPEDVLDAAHDYLIANYGSSPLAHPVDRARILSALS